MILDFEELKKRRKMKRKLPDFSKKSQSADMRNKDIPSGKDHKLPNDTSVNSEENEQTTEGFVEYEEYGLDLENTIQRLKLVFRSGESVAIPYAHNPVIIANSDGDVIMLTDQYRVIIQGRNLDEMEAFLCFEKVTWIAESPLDTAKADNEPLVSDIIIDGALFEHPEK